MQTMEPPKVNGQASLSQLNQTDSGIPGLGAAHLPVLPELDDNAELHEALAAVLEGVTDENVLDTLRERVHVAIRKAYNAANLRTGTGCLIREVDHRVWSKQSGGAPPPEKGLTFGSLAACGKALGVGYNALSVKRRRANGSSVIEMRGVTIEIL